VRRAIARRRARFDLNPRTDGAVFIYVYVSSLYEL
jgi:hypothetical protein